MLRAMISATERVSKVILAIFMVGLVVAVFLQVFTRFVLNNPLSWTEELARYLFIWVTFLAVGLCLRQGAFIGIDVLTNLLPGVAQKALEAVVLVLIGGFCLLLVYYGFVQVGITMLQVSPGIGMKMGYVYAAIPVGGIVALLEVVDLLLTRTLRGSE